jgi:hypothetical protein
MFIFSPFFVHLASRTNSDADYGKINRFLRVIAHVTPGLIFCQGLGVEQSLRKLN